MTEEKADELYGPAPTGDEAPHTSQAVPDPEAPFTAGQLNSSHLGRNIRVHERRNGYKFGAQGKLTAINHGASIIRDKPISSEVDSITLGRAWAQLTFDADSGTRVSPEAWVEFING
jgi:hypothetical protein